METLAKAPSKTQRKKSLGTQRVSQSPGSNHAERNLLADIFFYETLVEAERDLGLNSKHRDSSFAEIWGFYDILHCIFTKLRNGAAVLWGLGIDMVQSNHTPSSESGVGEKTVDYKLFKIFVVASFLAVSATGWFLAVYLLE